jgi:hypothetical protein
MEKTHDIIYSPRKPWILSRFVIDLDDILWDDVKSSPFQSPVNASIFA